MDFNELKENAEQICKELKDKAPADLSALALSLSAIIKNDDNHGLWTYGTK